MTVPPITTPLLIRVELSTLSLLLILALAILDSWLSLWLSASFLSVMRVMKVVSFLIQLPKVMLIISG